MKKNPYPFNMSICLSPVNSIIHHKFVIAAGCMALGVHHCPVVRGGGIAHVYDP